jgi:diadenosine tetraphosphate (Ap4A) HIT family hydrolase
VWVDEHWRVAHSLDAALPGWLVAIPRRHVEALDELGHEEVASLGPLLRDASAALRAVVGCVKTYVMLLAEKEGFGHVHFHVVPRMADQPDELRGPRIFGYLGRPEGEWVTEDERDALALRLRAAWP